MKGGLISDLNQTHLVNMSFRQLADRSRAPELSPISHVHEMGDSSIQAPGAPFSQLKKRWRCVLIGPVAMLSGISSYRITLIYTVRMLIINICRN